MELCIPILYENFMNILLKVPTVEMQFGYFNYTYWMQFQFCLFCSYVFDIFLCVGDLGC